jgi:hypothetical protein
MAGSAKQSPSWKENPAGSHHIHKAACPGCSGCLTGQPTSQQMKGNAADYADQHAARPSAIDYLARPQNQTANCNFHVKKVGFSSIRLSFSVAISKKF